MALPGDRMPGYTNDPYTAREAAYGYEHRDTRAVEDARETEVTAGPFRFGLREGLLGILALFAILGVVLGVLGFAAAFALDRATEATDGGTAIEDAAAGAAALPAILVGLLPFLAAPVLALGCGAWAGHASRNARIGWVSGAIGGFLGPILTLLILGIGFALGAGAANLNIADIDMPGGLGLAPGWGTTIPYLFTGAGLLWLVANALSGGLSGGVVGGLLDRRWSERVERRRAYSRRATRY